MPTQPSVAEIREIPTALTATVEESWIDENGHMNVRHYFDLQERATVAISEVMGIDESYPARTGAGVFTLEQHLAYVSECLLGDEVSVHIRHVSHTAKTLHMIGYIVNDTRSVLSHVLENMIAHIDLTDRRISPWPAHAAEGLVTFQAQEPAWKPALAGCLGAR